MDAALVAAASLKLRAIESIVVCIRQLNLVGGSTGEDKHTLKPLNVRPEIGTPLFEPRSRSSCFYTSRWLLMHLLTSRLHPGARRRSRILITLHSTKTALAHRSTTARKISRIFASAPCPFLTGKDLEDPIELRVEEQHIAP